MFPLNPRKKAWLGLRPRLGHSLRVYNLKENKYLEPCLQSGCHDLVVWMFLLSELSLLLSIKLD